MRETGRYEYRYCLACGATTEHELMEGPLSAGVVSDRWVCCNEVSCREIGGHFVGWVSRERNKEARRARFRHGRKSPPAIGSYWSCCDGSGPAGSGQPGGRMCTAGAFELAKRATAGLGEASADESSLAESLKKEA